MQFTSPQLWFHFEPSERVPLQEVLQSTRLDFAGALADADALGAADARAAADAERLPRRDF